MPTIIKYVDIEQVEVEINISTEECVAALLELKTPERMQSLLSGFSSIMRYLKYIPDELMSELSEEHSHIIKEEINKQMDRLPKPKADNETNENPGV